MAIKNVSSIFWKRKKKLSVYLMKNGQVFVESLRTITKELTRLDAKTIDEICVIGHSLAGVDRTYFNRIDNMTMRRLTWKVYYYRPEEKDRLRNNLIDAGVDSDRIEMVPSSEFYDL